MARQLLRITFFILSLCSAGVFAAILTFVGKLPFQAYIESYSLQVKYYLLNIRNDVGDVELQEIYLSPNQSIIPSAFHNLIVTTLEAHQNLTDYHAANTFGMPGGYSEQISADLSLIVDGAGNFSVLDLESNEIVPISSNLNSIVDDQNYSGLIIPELFGRFGLRDLYYSASREKLFVSLFVDVSGDGCYGIGVYQADLSSSVGTLPVSIEFEPFFESDVCNRDFNGHASGGRIEELDDRLILTVGSYDLNLYGDISIPQSPSNVAGKVIAISENSDYEVLSMGHRNQQGLEVVSGNIFITEHGPMGGDEINIIIGNGEHYGWPYVAFGFDYDYVQRFRLNNVPPFILPSYYFTPSIGISQLVFYDASLFPRWTNKFIVSSLKDQSLYLMDFNPETRSFISSERIEIGSRIRDLNVLDDGRLLLITDDQKVVLVDRSSADIVNNDANYINF